MKVLSSWEIPGDSQSRLSSAGQSKLRKKRRLDLAAILTQRVQEAPALEKNLFRDVNFAWLNGRCPRSADGGGEEYLTYYFDKRTPVRPNGAIWR